MSPEVLSRRALNRALLARQHLLARSAAHTPQAMLAHLVGMQGQVPMAPYTGLWSRIEGFDPAELAGALERREVVRMVLMRATVHMVTAADALTLLPLTQPMHDRVLGGSFAKRLAGLDRERVIARVLAATTAEPLTPKEIARHLQPDWPDHDEQILGIAGALWCGLVQVTPRGVWGRSGQAKLTPLAHWLGRPADPEPDLGAVLARYLGAFGPASVADMRTWSRLTRLDDAVAGLRERGTVVGLRDEDGRELFDLPDAPRPDPGTPAPPRLLPILDNLLLSHADRTRVIADEHRGATFNGTAFLVDGFVAGTHRLVRAGRDATLELTALRRIAKRERARLEREATRLLAFLEPERRHAVRWRD